MTTTYLDATDSMINRAKDNLPVGLILKNVKYPNAPFNPVAGTTQVRLRVQHGRMINIEPGLSGLSRSAGVMFIDIFEDKGTGNKRANFVADHYLNLFRRKKFDSIRSQEVQLTEFTNEENKYRLQLSIYFNFDYR